MNRKILSELFRVGWPIGGMLVIEIGLFLVIAFMMGRLGANVLAAHQIVLQYWGMSIAVYFGVTQTATIRVGHAVGRNDKQAVRLAGYVNMLFGFILMTLVAIYYIAFPKSIIGIDINLQNTHYAKLIHYAVIYLALSAAYQLFDSFRLIAIGALRGLKDTRIPMVISGITFWVIALPLSYLFGFVFHLSGAGIWLGLVIGIAVGALVLVLRFKKVVERVELEKLLIWD